MRDKERILPDEPGLLNEPNRYNSSKVHKIPTIRSNCKSYEVIYLHRGIEMLLYNKYLKKLGLKEEDYFVFQKKDDKRNRLNKKIGLVPSEIWNLDATLILTLYTYITHFKEERFGYPSYLSSDEEWDSILGKMQEGFKRYILYFMVGRGEEYEELSKLERHQCCKREEEIYKAVKDSLDLIKEHFFDLWF